MGARGMVPLVTAVAAVVVLAGCTTTDGPVAPGPGVATTASGAATTASSGAATTTSSGAVAGAAPGCASRVETGVLPAWAHAGFSGDPRLPHVLGVDGEIVAVLFGHPLGLAADGSNNKILWVARPLASTMTPPTPLTITATLDGGDLRVTREVAGGPGPSIVDLPRAGCWHLELRWSGRTDTMDLVYADS